MWNIVIISLGCSIQFNRDSAHKSACDSTPKPWSPCLQHICPLLCPSLLLTMPLIKRVSAHIAANDYAVYSYQMSLRSHFSTWLCYALSSAMSPPTVLPMAPPVHSDQPCPHPHTCSCAWLRPVTLKNCDCPHIGLWLRPFTLQLFPSTSLPRTLPLSALINQVSVHIFAPPPPALPIYSPEWPHLVF